MENPATWGLAERTVQDALRAHRDACDEGVIGLSLTRTITDALRRKGLLKEDADAGTV